MTAVDLHPGRTPDVPRRARAGVEDDRSGLARSDARMSDAGSVDQAPVSQRANDAQAPIADGSTSADQDENDAQTRTVGGPLTAAANAHTAPICGSPQQLSTSAEATRRAGPTVFPPPLTPSPSAAAEVCTQPNEPPPQLTDPLPAEANAGSSPAVPASRLADIQLALLAEAVDDLERTRIANENRWRSLIQVYGLEGTPQEKASRALVDGLVELEHRTTLQLARAMRAHPLGGWVKGQRGVGEKQAARLLAAVGDPYWNALHDRPRTVSELWAFAGLHAVRVGQTVADGQIACADTDFNAPAGQRENGARVAHASGSTLPVGHTRPDAPRPTADGDDPPGTHVAARRRKGQRANWSATAKMRAYLIATSCVKQLKPVCKPAEGETVVHGPDCVCSPYRVVYDQRRARTAVTHADWTPLHSHNDGLRIAAKTVLKDMWREARRLHEADDDDD